LLHTAAVGEAHIVLTGGSTPRAAYQSFARDVAADLGLVTFWFGDERCVPPDDERSNYLMAQRSLLDALPAGALPRVRRIEGELGPDAAAASYEQSLRAAGPPAFDLLLLGLGPDGHTASLFPGQRSLSVRDRLVVGVPEAGLEPFVPRVTLTLPALAAARHVVFLVAGEAKADAVAAAFGRGARADPHVPASIVPTLADRVTVLLDPPAAAKL
jgi:6-phosphogluconolactonase